VTTSLSFERPVVSGRVRLSGLTAEALAGMSSWLPAALAPEWTMGDLEEALKTATGVLISDGTGDAIGLAVVQMDAPGAGCTSVPLIAIEPSRRFRGLGGEAGIALDAQLRAFGYDRVYAPVPDGRGLAVYFWLRLGFRPLRLDEAPGPVTGLLGETRAGMWMLRGRLDSGDSGFLNGWYENAALVHSRRVRCASLGAAPPPPQEKDEVPRGHPSGSPSASVLSRRCAR
jgi:hypothetical protein